MRTAKIGIEIEGGWDYEPAADIYGDGSVSVGGDHSGEICSPPLSLPKVQAWMRENYPSFTNSTCGLHIHISLKRNLDYSRLMSPNFYTYFLHHIEKWAEGYILKSSPFWNRLRGANSYCRREFKADEQVLLTHKESPRYTHLNYCFSLHHTLECRLFPTFKQVEVACHAVRAFVDIVEAWLEQQPKKEQSFMVAIGEETEAERIFVSDEIDQP